MFNVGIISDLHDWHSKEIEFFLKKKNCKVTKIKFDDLIFKFENKTISSLNNKEINKLDGLWVRFLKSGSTEEITTKLTILHLLEEMKVYVHNSANVVEKTVDKVRTTGLLELNNLESPITFVSFKNNLKESFVINEKNKYLLKPIFGSQGKNIKKINNFSEFKNITAVGNVFYLQKFLDSKKNKLFFDLRVLVSNHSVVGAMERSSGNFLTNVFQGSKIKKAKIDEKLKKMCEKVSKIFNLGYGGIDIKFHDNKYYILEVNSIPSWKALQSLYKKNISKILVRDFVDRLKR